MNFKVKKAYYRLFSVLLSLVMIVLTVPISASAELSSDDATEASESVQSENLGKIESGEISLPINPAEMTAVTDDVITDGVYAFRNVNNPNMWLDTGFSSPLPDSYMQQYAYPTAPNATNAFYKGGLFKIKCMSTANPHYVIRLMTNNELIFRPNTSTSYVHSLKVSPTDTAVPSASRYLLQKTDAGYIIKLVGSPYCIATPQSNVSGEGTVASRLTYLSPTEAQTNTRAQWQLYKYEGSQRSEIALSISPDEMVLNETTTVSGYLSSTVIGFNGPVNYSVSETYDMITDKATVNSTSGELTANAVGEIKLWVNSGTCTNYKIIKIAENVSGTYFFNNVEYPNKYVQIDNNNDMLGEEIIELHNFLGYDYQRWTVDYISNGYYKIISEYSNLELTAPTGYGNDVVTQTSPSSANTHLWKFIKQSDETYEISPKSNSNCFLAAGDESSAADQDLEIRSAQSDGRDEWELTEIQYTANVLNYFDMGYPVRYGESSSVASSKINSYIDMVGRQYLRLFGLEISPFNATYYQSPLDLCKGTVTINNIDNLCSHGGVVHSERSNVISDFNSSHVGDSKTTYVLWSCHKITSTATSGVVNYNRSCSFGTGIFLIAINTSNRDQKSQAVLMHELNHQYGARDHYHELADPNDYNSCKFKDICSECGDNKRPSSCIMNTTSVDINSDSVICQPCIEEILAHLSDHHQ